MCHTVAVRARAPQPFGINMTNITETSTKALPLGDANSTFPKILPSMAWIAAYFALQFAVTAIVIAIAIGAQQAVEPGTAIDPAIALSNPMLIIWGLVASALVQLALMSLYLRKDGRAEAIGLTHFGRIPISTTLLVAVGALLVASLFNFIYATYLVTGIPLQDEMTKLLASIPRTPINIAVGLLAIAIVAPLIEELLFRGLLQNSLMRHMPAWAAIMLSAFLFSAVHMQLYAMPALMALGAAFGFIYYKTGSLRMTIVLHMINNALALALTQVI